MSLQAPIRRGAVLLEALLGLPVLVLITLAAVQYGQAVLVDQAVGAAANEAAREAAKAASPLEVEAVVDQMLGVVNLTTDENSGVRVDVQFAADAGYRFGDESLPDPSEAEFSSSPTNAPDVNEVRIVIQARYSSTKVPNILGYFGVNLQNRYFTSSALARLQ